MGLAKDVHCHACQIFNRNLTLNIIIENWVKFTAETQKNNNQVLDSSLLFELSVMDEQECMKRENHWVLDCSALSANLPNLLASPNATGAYLPTGIMM